MRWVEQIGEGVDLREKRRPGLERERPGGRGALRPATQRVVLDEQCELHLSLIRKAESWSAWVAPQIKCPDGDFNSGQDLRVTGSSPESGSLVGVEPA